MFSIGEDDAEAETHTIIEDAAVMDEADSKEAKGEGLASSTSGPVDISSTIKENRSHNGAEEKKAVGSTRWSSSFLSWGRTGQAPASGSVVAQPTDGKEELESRLPPPQTEASAEPTKAGGEKDLQEAKTDEPRKGGLWNSLSFANPLPTIWNTAQRKRPQYKMGEFVRLDQYVESHQGWSFFACKKVVGSSLHPWYLVVTSDELLELKVHDEKRFLVAVDNVHSLENIIKITFKKKTPKLLTFSYCSENSSSGTVNNPSQPPPAPAEDEGKGKLNEEGEGGPNQPTDDTKKHHSMRRYVVERPTECISTVTRAVDAFVKRNLAV